MAKQVSLCALQLALITMLPVLGNCLSQPIYPTTSRFKNSDDLESCKVNLCANAGTYPSSPDIQYYAEFDIPPIPLSFSNVSTTYYIYFNIFFRNPSGGKFNQFVPQLMLGNALSGSSNEPNYLPQWNQLNTWHFGSQYFFGMLNASDTTKWDAFAATGDLIPTKQGDTVYTQFELSSDKKTWTLSMGIKGDTSAVSVVSTDKPFMGLLNSTSSWDENIYNETYVGSCWELYGLTERQNYPNYMHYMHNISSATQGNWWKSWYMAETPTCGFSPNYTLKSTVNSETTDQIALFDIFYPI